MPNIGELIFRMGFWGQFYYTYNKEPPKHEETILEWGLGLRFLCIWGKGREVANIGELIFRMGFWGTFYYNYNKEPPKHEETILKWDLRLRFLQFRCAYGGKLPSW